MARRDDATSLDVTLICQWFAPEPVTQPGWIVDGLRATGLKVSVLTGVPNYPSGRVAEGYRAWLCRSEVLDGIPVRRTPLFPSHDRRPLRRLVNYASWALSSALFGQRMLRRADVVLVYSSPASAALPALTARLLFGTPYVLYIQDLWPDSISASGMAGGACARILERLLMPITKLFYRGAARVLVISPGMAELLAERGVPRDKVSLVYNWVPTLESSDEAAPDMGLRFRLGLPRDAFMLMYAGNHGAAQALDAIIEAVGLLPDEMDVHLVLVGDGVEKEALRDLAERVAPRHVHFLDPVPSRAMPQLLQQADAGVVSLASEPLFAVTMPSKIQALLAYGSPILLCGFGDPAAVIEEARAGVVAPPSDPRRIAAAITKMQGLGRGRLQEMGQCGQRYFEATMSPSVSSRRLAEELERATSRPGPKRRRGEVPRTRSGGWPT